MKTVLAIPLVLLTIFSGLTVSFDTHYCGGIVASTKISLNGELASCGMEKSSQSTSRENLFSNKCCDDVTSAYSICNNYVSSHYSPVDPGVQVVPNIYFPLPDLISQKTAFKISDTNVRPPGTNVPNMVFRPALCVFLI
jgi:hypothetical protein